MGYGVSLYGYVQDTVFMTRKHQMLLAVLASAFGYTTLRILVGCYVSVGLFQYHLPLYIVLGLYLPWWSFAFGPLGTYWFTWQQIRYGKYAKVWKL